jgi:DNA-directed RNA polymerase subunit RPC12/RpoP
MTKDILIDLTQRPRKRYQINRCHYCSHDKFPEGKPIDPTTDHSAKQMEDGSYKCGVCVAQETTKLLSLFGGQKK